MQKINFPTFGPGGNSEAFALAGKKSSTQAPEWIKSIGLDAYEFEAGRGINASEAVLAEIGEQAKRHGVLMSFHTPYFISLSSVEEEKRTNSIEYIRRSLAASELLGADTIVIHTGSAAKITREQAMKLASDTLERNLLVNGDTSIRMGLETMGKLNQLGTLEEVIELCKISPKYHPVVEFGHLNARYVGGYFPDCDSYRRIFDKIACELGDDYAYNLHCHFSKIEFTEKGEKQHLTFSDSVYGPDFEPLAEAIIREGVCPRIICESAGTQSDDALAMKQMWLSAGGKA
ncbi:MAG: TIM barrel protein [Clostridia bacterium]|nr:TIM barrel protein [Clostridia bacterium]